MGKHQFHNCYLIFILALILGTPSDNVSLVTKCERFVFERSDDVVLWFLYAGGCSSALEGVDPSHIISVYSAKEKTSQSFMPFGSRVVDFMGLPKFLGLYVTKQFNFNQLTNIILCLI